MKKVLLTLFITLVTTFNIVSASTWVQVDDDNYIDMDSVKYYVNDHGVFEYNKKVFWMKSIKREDFYKDIEKQTKKKISHCLTQNIIDYSNQTVAVKSSILYATDGNSIINDNNKDYGLEWHSIAPNSNGELWAELVKKPRMLKRMYKYQNSTSPKQKK